MADGSLRRADAIRAGDRVLDPRSGIAAPVLRLVVGPQTGEMIELGAGGRTLQVTPDHPIETDRGMRAAKALAVGERLWGEDHAWHRIDTMRHLRAAPGLVVWNFELGGAPHASHRLAAEGLVTGDFTLQRRLQKGLAR
jgi:hypothetical protein